MADPDYQAYAAWVEAQKVPGLKLEIVRLEGRTPLIYIEVPAANGGSDDDCVLLYGHLDKQPEMTGWDADLGPWTPVLRDGKHVVTANKALLAHHGNELSALAERKGVALALEAAVAGGIPVIKGLREGAAANEISQVFGILNGTCNFILSKMEAEGRDFAEVLAEARRVLTAAFYLSRKHRDAGTDACPLPLLCIACGSGRHEFARVHRYSERWFKVAYTDPKS